MMSAETTWPITLPLSRRSASSLRISVIQATRPKHHGMPQTPLDPAGLHGERGATEWRVERPAFKRLNSRSLSTFERRKSRYVKNVFKPVTKECISERANKNLNKKLCCRREAARSLASLNIYLSHLKSFEVSRACVSPYRDSTLSTSISRTVSEIFSDK